VAGAVIFDDAYPGSNYTPPVAGQIIFNDVGYPIVSYWYFLAPPFANV
jgi:hypothetical protein